VAVRTDGVDDPLGRQAEPGSGHGRAGSKAVRQLRGAQLAAGFEQFRPGRPVDRAVHAATAQERGIGGVDNRIHRPGSDIALNYFNPHAASFTPPPARAKG
jgi:hypothetical protein